MILNYTLNLKEENCIAIVEKKLTTKLLSDGEKATVLVSVHLLSKLAIAMTFFPFFLNS